LVAGVFLYLERVETQPHISIIVAARNEQANIAACLLSLTSQVSALPYEVICVDNGSADDTAKIAALFPVRLVSEARRGKENALQTGVLHARGKLLCFTDADCVVPPTWLSSILAAFARHPGAIAVVGGYRYLEAQPLYRALNWVFLPISIWGFFLLTGSHSLRGSNFAVHKADYLAAGGMDSRLVSMGDVDFGLRLAKLGRIHFVGQMQIATSNRRIRGRLLKFAREFLSGFSALFTRRRSAKRSGLEEIR
jgi:glycosyltransferase involved in cell wall biosynthesis